MTKNDKQFLKQKYNIDLDNQEEDSLNKKIIEIIKKNNEIIKLKQQKNRLLSEKINTLLNNQ